MAEPILPSLPTLNKSVREFRRVIQENVEQNKDKKKIDLKQQELVRQTLGISQKRLEQQQKAAAVAEESRNQLNDLKKTLEDQGVDVKKNANFQKLELEVARKERAARLKAMPRASALKEQAKESGIYLRNVLGKYLGPGSKIGGLLGNIAGNLKTKVTGGIDTLFGILKKGLFVAAIGALIVFLDSPIWKEWKESLIPMLAKGIKRVTESLKRIFEAFFGRAGGGPGAPEKKGSFLGGVQQILFEVFGRNSGITKGIFAFAGAMKRIFYAFFGDPNDKSKKYGFFTGIFQTLEELGILTDDTDKANEEIGRFGNIGLAAKTLLLVKAFNGVGTVLKRITQSLTGITGGGALAATAAAGAGLRTGQEVRGKGKYAGKFFRVNKAGRLMEITGKGGEFLKGPIPKGMTQASILENIKPPTGSLVGKVGSRGLKVLGFLNALVRKLPFLGGVLAINDAITALSDPNLTKPEKAARLAEIMGGVGGAYLGAIAGGLIGTAFPIIGNFVGAGVGGIAGYFGGEMLAKGIGQYAAGMNVDAFPTLPSFFGIGGFDLNSYLNGTAKKESNTPTTSLGENTRGSGGVVYDTNIGGTAFQQMFGSEYIGKGGGSVNAAGASIDPLLQPQNLPSLQTLFGNSTRVNGISGGDILQQIDIATRMVMGPKTDPYRDSDDLGNAPTVVINKPENISVKNSITEIVNKDQSLALSMGIVP